MEATTCHVNGEPCEVLVSTGVTQPDTVAVVAQHLPCERCRLAEAKARELPGTRFGRHERRILLWAPAPEARAVVFEPENDSPAADEALRRAMRKLQALGLITRWSHPSHRRLSLKLSPLGAAVVDLIRPKLEAGVPIRWADYPDFLSGVRACLPELVQEFQRTMREYRAPLVLLRVAPRVVDHLERALISIDPHWKPQAKRGVNGSALP